MTYDVIVVGARAAGAATAMLTARAGLTTLVIERGAPDTDALSTHALLRGGVLQLARWGLLDRIVAAGTPPVRRVTFTYGSERLAVPIRAQHGIDALYAPRRTVLDPLLVEAAQAAGAEVRFLTTMTRLEWRGDRVTGVHIVGPTGRPRFVAARLVVGADGMRSNVARLTGAPVTHQGAHGTATTYGYWNDVAVDGYETVFRPDACAGLIPTNDGQVCVFACATPTTIGRGGVATVARIVAASDPDLGDRLDRGTAPAGTRTWSGARGFLRRPFGPGWALVGDAGYFKDPLSSHGITDALRDGELLARAIVSGIGDRAALDAELADYAATRDRLSLPMFEVVDRIASQRWDGAEIADLLIRLGAAANAEVDTLAGLDLVMS